MAEPYFGGAQAGGTAPSDCTAFLQWALPRLGLRWAGYRKVRGQVCKRLRRRLSALGLADLVAYREHLDRDAAEWRILEGLCRVTISRFYRNRGVFDHLRAEILPALCGYLRQDGASRLRCLSLGCCGGEEPYTLALLWRLDLARRCPDMTADILATDSDPASLARAARGCYGAGSLKDLPPEWKAAGFEAEHDLYCLRPEIRRNVRFLEQDLRAALPAGPFDLVLCRNLAFTYFDEAGQRQTAERLARLMPPGGILMLGKHERLPAGTPGFEAVSAHRAIYRRGGDIAE
ncbi:MAG: chemotaxis protein CheR [Inquilinus sp.]|nr:chemotaxis protein CheR [Inquilinus sp.]